jgi:hypothetical protein
MWIKDMKWRVIVIVGIIVVRFHFRTLAFGLQVVGSC